MSFQELVRPCKTKIRPGNGQENGILASASKIFLDPTAIYINLAEKADKVTKEKYFSCIKKLSMVEDLKSFPIYLNTTAYTENLWHKSLTLNKDCISTIVKKIKKV